MQYVISLEASKDLDDILDYFLSRNSFTPKFKKIFLN